MNFDWRMPVTLRYGTGCADEMPAALGGRGAVVMAFEPAGRLGLEARWRATMGDRLLDWIAVPDGLSSLAQARDLSERIWPQLKRHTGCVLVAVGGGTTMDLAKVVRCRPRQGGFDHLAAALRGQAPWPELDLLPLWLLPTTAGTGSEVTRWATVWDTDSEPAVKRSLDEPFGYAERAWIDPALTLSCPPSVTRDTALDALAHALESIWNRHGNPLSNRLAVSAARRVIDALPGCLADPGDLSLRSALSLAALEAGMAFSQTRTALAHALSYAVTLEQGVPHGLACALWLPTAWQLAVGRDAQVDACLADVLGAPVAAGPDRLQDWLRSVGVDARPEAFGIADAPARVDAALCSPRGRNFLGAP